MEDRHVGLLAGGFLLLAPNLVGILGGRVGLGLHLRIHLQGNRSIRPDGRSDAEGDATVVAAHANRRLFARDRDRRRGSTGRHLAAGGLGKRRAADHLRGFGFGHREIDDLEGVVPERSDADQIEGKNGLEIDDGLGLGDFFVDLEIVRRGRERGRAEDEFPRVEPEGVEDGVDVGVGELERDEFVFGFSRGDSR